MDRFPTSRSLGATLLALWMFSAGGCGFSPLYATRDTEASSQVVDALSKVIVRSLPDREGMKLRQVLREQLQPQGLAANPLYELEITLTKRVEELGIRKDATSSRANLNLSASFYLHEAGQRVFGDYVQTVVSYNILDDQYATGAAQADAENRAIRQVGQEIKTRLAVYFERRTKPTPVALATH